MHTHKDTIVAISTPPGEGAIGVIRISGIDAITISTKIFIGKNLNSVPTHTLHFGRISIESQIIDEVVIGIFKAPKSYTGEDIIEISCHGSNYILEQVLNLCILKGARLAKPGEFTQRAFLNGKLDLTQAESVADLIAAQTETANRAAMHHLRGGFTQDLQQMRATLIQFSALIELELDFSEEDVEFADRTRFYDLITHLIIETNKLINSFSLGNVIINGVKVAISGKPNAGKSTLLNTLLNEERAIVSEIAGTTRDTIEETLNINGVLFRLIDTAGIRDHAGDQIEKQGIERSHLAINKADIVVYLFDVNDETEPAILAHKKAEFDTKNIKYLLVGNKIDETNEEYLRQEYALLYNSILFISARNKVNIKELKQAFYQQVVSGTIKQEGTIITNARHYNALQEVLKSLYDIKTGLDTAITGDFLALDIRRCLYYLGEITGVVTNEDTLDYIFSKFCIGK